MIARAEVLGQPTPGVGARQFDLAVAVEQHHRGAGRRIVGKRAREAPARLRGPQRTLEPRARDIEHVTVALGELALGAPKPGDDRLTATSVRAPTIERASPYAAPTSVSASQGMATLLTVHPLLASVTFRHHLWTAPWPWASGGPSSRTRCPCSAG